MRTPSTGVRAAVLTAALVIGFSTSAFAQPGEPVVVGGQVVMTIRAGAEGWGARDRAKIAHERIVEALSIGPVQPQEIVIRMYQGTPVIYARHVRIITVTLADARLNHSTPLGLAVIWRDNLRSALPGAVPVPKPIP